MQTYRNDVYERVCESWDHQILGTQIIFERKILYKNNCIQLEQKFRCSYYKNMYLENCTSQCGHRKIFKVYLAIFQHYEWKSWIFSGYLRNLYSLLHTKLKNSVIKIQLSKIYPHFFSCVIQLPQLPLATPATPYTCRGRRKNLTQLTLTCSKSTREILEKGVSYVQS